MTAPPPYPRVPHLVAGRGSGDDLVLDAGVAALLAGPVVVEEKLDGANVMVWAGDRGQLEVALRSGPGALDRAGQLGPLRAWVAAHDEQLRPVLTGGAVLYAEWLLLRHTVAYDRLPSFLVALDLWRPCSAGAIDACGDPQSATGFVPVAERDATGLVVPPRIADGKLRNVAQVEALLGPSAWASTEAMEGLVVRSHTGHFPRVAKLVRRGWRQIDDDAWRAGRPHNQLEEGVASWR